MNETVNTQEATTETTAEAQTERTFTQAELDGIVAERLKRERAKYEGFEDFKAKAAKLDEIEEANKSELQKATDRASALESELNALKKEAEVRTIRDKVSADTGVPATLLTADTAEGCEAQAKAILDFKGVNTYPVVKDGGEVHQMPGLSAKDAFKEWASKVL